MASSSTPPKGAAMEQFQSVWESLQPTWHWSTKSGEDKAKTEEFRLPKSHKIEENLDKENLEQASLDKGIPPDNLGYRLLLRMGWTEGQGLGRARQGIVDPIRTDMNEFRLGLGKQEQDDYYTNEENIQRKKLEIEMEETEELAQKREAEAQRLEKIQAEVKEMKKVFLCELCNKQYKLASEFELHLDSYDHNHKKRFKESVRGLTEKEKEERQRREKLREQKELQKRAQLLSSQKPVFPSPDQAVDALVVTPALVPPTASAPAAHATSAPAPAPAPAPGPAPLQPQRSALKFGFSGKAKGALASKVAGKGKTKIAPVAPLFGGEDDDEGEN